MCSFHSPVSLRSLSCLLFLIHPIPFHEKRTLRTCPCSFRSESHLLNAVYSIEVIYFTFSLQHPLASVSHACVPFIEMFEVPTTTSPVCLTSNTFSPSSSNWKKADSMLRMRVCVCALTHMHVLLGKCSLGDGFSPQSFSLGLLHLEGIESMFLSVCLSVCAGW